jgi:hypothetical protein
MDGIVWTPEVERALDGKPPTPVAAVASPASAPALAPVPSTADGSQAVALDPEPSTPEPSAPLEAPGASTEPEGATDAAAAAAPAAFAPEGSTGGAATRPRDHENESPNKGLLKKPSVVKHSDSDPTAQNLTFAAAAPAAAAAAE